MVGLSSGTLPTRVQCRTWKIGCVVWVWNVWVCVRPSCTDKNIYINSCYFISYFFASSFLIRRKPFFYSNKLFFLCSPCSEFMLLNYYERVHENFYERVVLYCTANQRFFSRLHACMSVNHRLVCKSAAMWIQKNVPFALSCVSVMDGSQESKSVTYSWPHANKPKSSVGHTCQGTVGHEKQKKCWPGHGLERPTSIHFYYRTRVAAMLRSIDIHLTTV